MEGRISKSTEHQAGMVKRASPARKRRGNETPVGCNGQGRTGDGTAGRGQDSGQRRTAGRAGQGRAHLSPESAAPRSLRAAVSVGRSGSPSTGSRTGKGEKMVLNSAVILADL